MANLPILSAFYGSDDPMAVAKDLINFEDVRYLPRRDCLASTLWNHLELDVQNTTDVLSANIIRVSWVGRPNGSG